MKTAISVPDDTFDQATKRAHELGMSRSEFFTVAARRYLDELDRASVTERINESVAEVTQDDSGAEAAAAGLRRVAAQDDW